MTQYDFLNPEDPTRILKQSEIDSMNKYWLLLGAALGTCFGGAFIYWITTLSSA